MKSIFNHFQYVFIITQAVCSIAFAQWFSNPSENNPICTANSWQQIPKIVSDGNGGAIVTWQDFRAGSVRHIFAQKISQNGTIAWTKNGVPICYANYEQTNPVIVADNAGGAIIAWADYRDGNPADIYAQHINSNGSPLWKTDGIPICVASGQQLEPMMISDDSGGAIIIWNDRRNFLSDYYIQRVDASGKILWKADGVKIVSDGSSPEIVENGFSGAFITWQDGRNGTADIFIQQISSTGVILWQEAGINVASGISKQELPQIISDHAHGAIIAWQDDRTGEYDLYGQRINESGVVQWTTNGKILVQKAGNQQNPKLADGSYVQNGTYEINVLLSWTDIQNAIFSIYAQRLNSLGDAQWGAGIYISSTTNQYEVEATSDLNKGLIVSWLKSSPYDIYAQRITSTGNKVWGTNGVPVATANGSQLSHSVTSDGKGGAIVAWEDHRTDQDIYASYLPATITDVQFNQEKIPSTFELLQNYPNPFNPTTRIRYSVPRGGNVGIKVFNSIGEEVSVLVSGYRDIGNYEVQFDGKNQSSGIYWCRMEAGDFTQTIKVILLK
jgi:hypothetical protein